VVKINNDLHRAVECLRKAEIKALECPYRPKYHFLPIANWMNDPNGPIFYNGEYHIFYQHYPYKDTLKFDQFWEMSWGHAKSSDLVHWEHLPIALMPSHKKGEDGCWSGTCILNNDIPTIIYTSVSTLKSPHNYAEQWLATSKDGMITWDKYFDNPILTPTINSQFEIHDWRDPFIWRESDKWCMIIGSHEHTSSTNSHGVIVLYESANLFDWKFKGPLSIGTRKQGRGWECPNFFSLENKHILIVSPFKEVIYSVGDYKSGSFLPNDWRILDHGKCFYATNTMLDDKKRRILWGWIKGGGMGGWNGCLSLPRILTLDKNDNLIINPPKELEKLRESHFEFKDLLITENSELFLGNFPDLTLEIIAKFRLNGNEKFGINLFLDDIPGENIEFDAANFKINVGKEIGKLNYEKFPRDVIFHVFVDKSVVEMYINYQECITSRVFPKTESSNGFSLFSKHIPLELKKMDIWSLKSIW
jgi:beta-fructofuranosidase